MKCKLITDSLPGCFFICLSILKISTSPGFCLCILFGLVYCSFGQFPLAIVLFFYLFYPFYCTPFKYILSQISFDNLFLQFPNTKSRNKRFGLGFDSFLYHNHIWGVYASFKRKNFYVLHNIHQSFLWKSIIRAER